MNYLNEPEKYQCSKGRNYLKKQVKKAVSRGSMFELSYALANGPYGS